MSLEEVFRNLKPEELEQATNWYNNLRTPEQKRVAETLRVINQTQFDLSEGAGEDIRPMSVIVAGSSIDTETYSDIDLFVLAETTLHSDNLKRRHPVADFANQIKDKLPDYSYVVIYKETDLRGEHNPKSLIEVGLGTRVTVSFFYELQGFDKRRSEKPDDLLESARPLGAEEIMRYNREQNSKFLVLNRQYISDISRKNLNIQL